MNQLTIKIEGKDLVIKQSFRALMEFERMTGRNAYEVNTSINDSVTFFYCILKGCNKGLFNYTFDDFLDILDQNPQILAQYNAYMIGLTGINISKSGEIPEGELERAAKTLADLTPAYIEERNNYKPE